MLESASSLAGRVDRGGKAVMGGTLSHRVRGAVTTGTIVALISGTVIAATPAAAAPTCSATYSTQGAAPGNVNVSLTWNPADIRSVTYSDFDNTIALQNDVRVTVIPRQTGVFTVYGGTGSSGSSVFQVPGGQSVGFLVDVDVSNGRLYLLCDPKLDNIPDTKPGISSITPNTAKVAGKVLASIRGANLTGATSASIGGVDAPIQSVTDTEVAVTVPTWTGVVGTPVDVVVVTPNGTATLTGGFTYRDNPPSVEKVTPPCGVTGGQGLTVNGTRLRGTSSVTIGGVSAPFTVTNPDATLGALSVTAPGGLTGAQPIVVTTPDGSSGGIVSVLYGPCSAPVPKPRIDSTRALAAGGLVTVNWSLPSTSVNPGTSNVLGVQYSVKDGLSGTFTPFAPVGGTFAGLSGSFTIAGLKSQVVYIQMKSVTKVAGDLDSGPVGVKVDFGSTPTATAPGTGNAGSVPVSGGSSGGTSSASSGGSSSSSSSGSSGNSSSTSGSSSGGRAPSAAAADAINAPCAAAASTLYPPMYGTVGSQLTGVPADIKGQLIAGASIAAGALPPGLALDGAFGIINGVPTRAGVYSATVTGKFLDGTPKSEKVTITVQDDLQTLQYALTNVGVVGSSFSVAPTTNAPADATYEVVCGEVPTGISFDKATGRLSGTPTQPFLDIVPLRVVERSRSGYAVASMIVAVVPQGEASVHYPADPHVRVGKRVAIRPAIVGASDLLYYKVIRGKLPRGLTIDHKTGVIVGRAKHLSRPHMITVAGVRTDGTLVLANPMRLTIRKHR
jgi:hypothetical protein